MKLDSGTEVLNKLLEGGFESDCLNTIYGSAATGKTTCCFLAAISVANKGGRTVFIDTEKGFSVERLQQLTKEYKKVLDKLFLVKVDSFDEQIKKVGIVHSLIKKTDIDLLVIDTIGAHYRAVLKDDVNKINKEMDSQLKILSDIARNYKTTVLITNQVYTDLKNNKTTIVGGNMLKNWSRCLIELKKLHGNKRAAILRKHGELEEKEVLFEIKERGLTPL